MGNSVSFCQGASQKRKRNFSELFQRVQKGLGGAEGETHGQNLQATRLPGSCFLLERIRVDIRLYYILYIIILNYIFIYHCMFYIRIYIIYNFIYF